MGMCVLGKGSKIGEIIIDTTYVNINASSTIQHLVGTFKALDFHIVVYKVVVQYEKDCISTSIIRATASFEGSQCVRCTRIYAP